MRGVFIKLPGNFNGQIESSGSVLQSVLIKGELNYLMPRSKETKVLDAGSYFSSTDKAIHTLNNKNNQEVLLYIKTNGSLKVIGA